MLKVYHSRKRVLKIVSKIVIDNSLDIIINKDRIDN